jgi:hypothetical protein
MDVSEMEKARQQTGECKPASGFSRGTVVDLVLIAVLWGIAVIIARPIGEFPLNDDWSYGLTAKRLAEGGGYIPMGWTEMTLFSHALWGALFCLPHGFSFTALRLSTLVLSLAGGLAMYGLVRQLRRPRLLACLCALTLVFNPIYFALSNTFMADVPFTTLAILSALFFVRHFQNGSDADVLIGTVFALIATLSRQVGLCLPFAFGVTLWLKHGFQRRWLIRAVVPFIVCAAMLAAFQLWMKVTGKSPSNNIRSDRLWAVLSTPQKIPLNLAYYGWGMLMYLGWFLLPLTLPALLSRRKDAGATPPHPARIAVFIFFEATAVRFFIAPSLMPVHGNILIPQGIGPATLVDIATLHLPHLPELPVLFWLLVTGLSLAGAAILVFKSAKAIVALAPTRRFAQAGQDGMNGTFFLLCAVAYLGPFLLSGYFDRYLIPVTAFLAAFITVCVEGEGFTLARGQRFVAMLLIAGSGVFGVAGTRDYLEWNRTRWKALKTLMSDTEVQPRNVDGGFEFNGWNMFDSFGRTNHAAIIGVYIVTFGEMPGYEPVGSYGYKQWLPPREGKILVLKHKGESQ